LKKINKGVDLMKDKNIVNKQNSDKDNEVKQLLKDISEKVREKNPELKRRRELLEKEGISIDDVIGYIWGSI
jgi:hypothetical protein